MSERGGTNVGWGGPLLTPARRPLQVKAAKSEQEARRLQLRSLQYLERYVYLVLFNAYLHLEKADSWPRPFSTWMREVREAGGEAAWRGPCGREAFSPLTLLFG